MRTVLALSYKTRTTLQCSAHVQPLQERLHDLSDAESDRDIERQLANIQQHREESRLEQELKEELGRSFTMICREFDMHDAVFEQLRRTVHKHHWHNLEILHKEQEEVKNRFSIYNRVDRLMVQNGLGWPEKREKPKKTLNTNLLFYFPTRRRHSGWD